MPHELFRTKSLDEILNTAAAHASLRRALGPGHVTLLGIGAIIGAGIFATVGTAAAGDSLRPGAGPSLILSFVITAVVCGFSALCYAEFAAMVPISGSAYTYAYATLGELCAWIIGWDLIIEYAVGNVAVAIGWSAYFRTLVEGAGQLLTGQPWTIPLWLCIDYRSAAVKMPEVIQSAPHVLGVPIVFNLLAAGIVAALTIVLVWGIRESAGFNAFMVVFKVGVLLFFVGAALALAGPGEMAAHWQPFQPSGWAGTLAGAAVVFFAYIGFDAVSTVAEETRRPERDMPIGIIGSLLICTVLYILVSAAFTGLVPYEALTAASAAERAEPLTMALERVAPDARWASTVVALGAVVATTAVLLVFQLGQPRIFFSMARDGLLPSAFARVHPRFKTPHVTTILTGLAVGGIAGVTNIEEMVDLTNIGTLFAFTLVCIGIPLLRYRDPDRLRPFRVPLGPWLLPGLGAISCLGLMCYLPPTSWWRFIAWMLLGLSVYSGYGFARSTLRRQARVRPLAASGGTAVAHGVPAGVSTPTRMKAAALGFLTAAVGAIAMPVGFRLESLLATGVWDATRVRAATALSLAFVGAVVGAAMFLRGIAARKQRA